MKQFLATFPAGCYGLIVKHLKSFRIDELEIIEQDDSAVLFKSSLPMERLIEVRYFTNVYLQLDEGAALPELRVKNDYFRLMLLKDGTPQPIDTSEKEQLETRIQRDYKLKPDSRLSRNDFYLIVRASGKKLFTIRLPRAKFKREKLMAGELRPELAHILCLAAGIKAKHVVLDMFAGYGSIPLEAVRGFGVKQVIAIDNHDLPKRHRHPSIKWHTADAGSLDFLADNSVDRVVTDPPWGIYDKETTDLASLYNDFVKELLRILKPDGVAVIMTGYAKSAKSLEQNQALKPIGKWNVLVSGKKATIYKLQKVR